MFSIFLLVVLLFSAIHFIEFSSFYSRIAGIRTDYKLISYTLQQTTFVMTRFCFVFMMPIIGYIVDKKISKNDYVLMVLFSLFFASISYLLSFYFRERIIYFFSCVITAFAGGLGFIKSFIIAFHQNLSYKSIGISKNSHNKFLFLMENKNIILLSSIVFCCYSIAVFLSFYFALTYYDLRATIGQTSGVINAFATLALTFYIEPKISRSIDSKSKGAENEVYSLLIGRFLGVSIISTSVFICILVLQ